MPSEATIPRSAELFTYRPDNFIRVENFAGSVVIRAALDNFSERRKAFFIRHLAAEGYIPGQFEYSCGPGSEPFSTVRWVIDRSWVRDDPLARRRANRFMVRLILGSFLLWLALVAFAVLRAR